MPTGFFFGQTVTVPEKLKMKIISITLLRRLNHLWLRSNPVQAPRRSEPSVFDLLGLCIHMSCWFSALGNSVLAYTEPLRPT